MIVVSNGPLVYIDDDEDDQLLFKQAVVELGFQNEIRFFGNGLEALCYLETTADKPLFILCDLNMPLMDGLELRRRIDESKYLKQKSIPFLYFTTAASPEQVQRAYQSDIQGIHTKAQSFSDLREKIQLIITYWQSCLHPSSFNK